VSRRAVDVVVSAAALALAAPILALAMILIRLESPGSPIYRQRRVGLHGHEFDVIKLRTMVSGAERMGAGWAVDAGDARITRVGAVLRRTSIDELPNLVNVLRGEMSLIGPRPTLPHQVEQYTPRQRGRLAVKPGITGWAQVNGRAGAALVGADRARPALHRAPLPADGPRDPAPQRRDGGPRGGHLQGHHGRLDGAPAGSPAASPDRPPTLARPMRAVLLTGVGQALRHRRGVRPAHHRRGLRPVAAGAGPVRRDRARAGPAHQGPGLRPALAALCAEHDVGRVVPLTDLDIEVLAHAARAGTLPALVPDAEIARRTFDKYETHLLLTRLGLPSPPTGPARRAVGRYPVMVKPRWGSGAAPSTRRARRRRRRSSRATSPSR
jgi:lipopolysaccharide/colanic/teichoic acid biosynthesis glycosyltransferase